MNHQPKHEPTLLLLTAALAVTLLAPGCSSRAPLRAMAKHNLAMMDLDPETAKKYCTQNYIDNNKEYFELGRTSYSSWLIPVPVEQRPSEEQIINKYTCRIVGHTAYAKAIEEYQGVMGDFTIVLVLVNGAWKIDRQEP